MFPLSWKALTMIYQALLKLCTMSYFGKMIIELLCLFRSLGKLKVRRAIARMKGLQRWQRDGAVGLTTHHSAR